ATTIPSGEHTGDAYTRSPRPSHHHNSLPVFGSNPFTFFGTPRMSSSRSPTRTMIGVHQEPSHSFGPTTPDLPPGSSCFHTVPPVDFLTASRNCRSPGPHHRMARSPKRIGDEALPQMCSSLPTCLRHNSLPVKS